MKLSKQELKSNTTKQKVLDAALHLLSEKGFDQMQVSQICKLAGISVGASSVQLFLKCFLNEPK